MSEEETCCKKDSLCDGFCFDDEEYIEKCLQTSCFSGYCESIECLECARGCIDKFCDSSDLCERCLGCCCFCYCNTPLFAIIVSTFWAMVFFFLFFMPPMIIVLLQSRMLKPKRFKTFDWIQKTEVRADTSENVSFKMKILIPKGHVESPCSCVNKGWFRCFVICNILCALGKFIFYLTFKGWFPGVIFASGMILFYFIQMCKEGW